MEIAAATIGVVNVTVRTSCKVWMLCESWKEAPKDVHLLRDSLNRAEEFFSHVKMGTEKASMDQLVTNPLQQVSLRRLEGLLHQGAAAVDDIDALVQKIFEGRDTGVDNLGNPEPLGKRRRIVWLMEASKLARLQGVLKEICAMTCASLMALNV